MIRVKRLSGTYHPQREVKFIARPFKNKEKPKTMVCPGDIIEVAHILDVKNQDQWQIISSEGKPVGSFEDVLAKDVEEIIADDGTKFKRKKFKKKINPQKKDLPSLINITTKHDGDVKHYVDSETGLEYVEHKDGKFEQIPEKESRPFQLIKVGEGLYNVINQETDKPVNSEPMLKKEAQRLM